MLFTNCSSQSHLNKSFAIFNQCRMSPQSTRLEVKHKLLFSPGEYYFVLIFQARRFPHIFSRKISLLGRNTSALIYIFWVCLSNYQQWNMQWRYDKVNKKHNSKFSMKKLYKLEQRKNRTSSLFTKKKGYDIKIIQKVVATPFRVS